MGDLRTNNDNGFFPEISKYVNNANSSEESVTISQEIKPSFVIFQVIHLKIFNMLCFSYS
jgi:hypothetical protein